MGVPLQALLVHLESLRGPAALPMMRVNCRTEEVTTPDRMARVLRQLALDSQNRWLDVDEEKVAEQTSQAVAAAVAEGLRNPVFGESGKVFAKAIDTFFSEGTLGKTPNLESVIEAYKNWLASLPAGETGKNTVPIIVIGAQPAPGTPAPRRCCLLPRLAGLCPARPLDDAARSETLRAMVLPSFLAADEANVLTEWREEGGESQLRHLLRFFVAITKEQERAHVVLATSDSFLLEWLEQSRWRCCCMHLFDPGCCVLRHRCRLPRPQRRCVVPPVLLQRV